MEERILQTLLKSWKCLRSDHGSVRSEFLDMIEKMSHSGKVAYLVFSAQAKTFA